MRLIDADELLKTNIHIVGSIMTPSGKIQNIDAIQVAEIKNAPTIDAVPVVRCKDCKFWKKQKDSLQGRCILMDHCSAGECYCWNGKLKEG